MSCRRDREQATAVSVQCLLLLIHINDFFALQQYHPLIT